MYSFLYQASIIFMYLTGCRIIHTYDLWPFINVTDYSHFNKENACWCSEIEVRKSDSLLLREKRKECPLIWQVIFAPFSEPFEWFKVTWLITWNKSNHLSCHLQITSQDLVDTDSTTTILPHRLFMGNNWVSTCKRWQCLITDSAIPVLTIIIFITLTSHYYLTQTFPKNSLLLSISLSVLPARPFSFFKAWSQFIWLTWPLYSLHLYHVSWHLFIH